MAVIREDRARGIEKERNWGPVEPRPRPERALNPTLTPTQEKIKVSGEANLGNIDNRHNPREPAHARAVPVTTATSGTPPAPDNPRKYRRTTIQRSR